jgi:hypothetical protein
MSPKTALDWASHMHAVENTIGAHTIRTLSQPAPPAR